MKKNVLKSNSAIMVIGDAPAWTTGEDTGRILSLVQNCNAGITYNRQKSKQIGSQDYSICDMIQAPKVDISLDYFLTPYLNNELLLGFNGHYSSYTPAVLGMGSRNQNIYMIIDTENARDGIEQFRTTSSGKNFSGYCALNFGNCYVNRYSVQYALNSVPVARVGLQASNVTTEALTGGRMTIPAINPVSGNATGAGYLDLSGLYQSLTGGFISGDYLGKTELNAPVALSNESSFYLQDLQVGGVPLSTGSMPILQTFDLELNLGRTELFGLGSNFAYDRKLELPVAGTVGISCIVSGLNSGSVHKMLYDETHYSMAVAFCDAKKASTGHFLIEGAKLENISYAMQVNDMLSFNASFSFQATDNSGFFIKRNVGSFTGASPEIWQSWDDIWQNIAITWENA